MIVEPPADDIALEEQSGVGLRDAFQRLYTPHRLAYIKGEGRGRDDECPFCAIVTMTDEDGLVVARGKTVYAVLNLYPYNAGHLLVVPYRHVADYLDMVTEEVVEMAFFTRRALRVLRETSGAHGFNTGMNLGHIAGAGIAAHVHQHVVPRWGGDANFMPVIGATRVLPALLGQTRDMLAEQWARTDPED
ncbi:HIT family protein [Candidatus Frankia nodulisporulans]|uniref:HIT family protein n=1 Tax=Candidatus Frankia nodulisporulans TaxID=2060052 RepID=UPI0013D496C2|nr:HIT domain-containing protein [Candidatus Frankia nodulisporulans]